MTHKQWFNNVLHLHPVHEEGARFCEEKSSPRSTNEEKTRFPGRRHQLARTQTSHSAVLNENIATLNVHSNVRIL